MKIWGSLCILMVFVVNTAFAIAPIDQTSIKQAQLYGSSQAKAELTDFLKPWLSYEEKAESLDEKSEVAYLYTPFLLIAMDAREKKLHNLPLRIEDSEKIITDYLDTLSFSIKLYGSAPEFSKNTTGVLIQKGKILNAWSAAIPAQAEVSSIKSKQAKALYEIQAYFYFDERELASKEPVTLVITTGDQKTHRFYFALAQVK